MTTNFELKSDWGGNGRFPINRHCPGNDVGAEVVGMAARGGVVTSQLRQSPLCSIPDWSLSQDVRESVFGRFPKTT